MVRKQNHKFHNILWNAYSYLKGRIMEFGKYLRTVILGLEEPETPGNPPWDGVYKEDWNRGVLEWFQPFSPHGKCHVSASEPPILLRYAFI